MNAQTITKTTTGTCSSTACTFPGLMTVQAISRDGVEERQVCVGCHDLGVVRRWWLSAR